MCVRRFLICLGLLFFFLAKNVLQAQTPNLINYQGRLTTGGTAAAGTFMMTFSIYAAATAGTALWSETQNVTVTNGIFNVLLGSATAFPRNLFTGTGDRYLGIKVGTDSEMTPRFRLVSAAYAIRASQTDTAQVAKTAMSATPAPNSVTSAVIVDGTVSNADLADNAVNSAKIAANAVTMSKILDGAVTSAKISSSQVVKSINTLKDDVTIAGGTNVTISSTGNTLTISSTGSGGGITGVTAGPGLSGGGTSGNVSLSVALSGITSTMIQDNTVTSTDILDGTIQTTDLNFTPGDITAVNVGAGLSGGGTTGSVTLAISAGAITSSMIQDGAVTDADVSSSASISGSKINPNFGPQNVVTTGSVGVGTTSPSAKLHTIASGSSGGYFFNSGTSLPALEGETFGSGAAGLFENTNSGNNIAALYGITNGGGAGIFGYTTGGREAGYFEIANSGNSFAAVYGGTNSGSGYAGYFNGRVHVQGTLSKLSGSFKIDHPLDPANKYLSHSFVESPDMMNIYNGNVTLDAAGEAVVELPKWFSALNRDFRYQLTPIGAPGPDLYIAEELSNNRFKIAGGKPGNKVSWQVTGIRQDPYANAHRIVVEEDKSVIERGLYLSPEVYGQPAEKSIYGAGVRNGKGEQAAPWEASRPNNNSSKP